METFRTIPPPHYLTPTREEMREMAEQVGLKRYSPSLLADMANVRAGGEILPPDAWRLEVERRVVGENIPPGRYKKYCLPDGGETHSFAEAVAAKVEKAVKYHTAVSDFVRTVDWSGVPGTTPLEQGANLLKLLAAKNGGEPGSKGGDEETLPIFQEEAGDTVARDLKEVLEEVEDLDKEDKELLEDDEEKKSSSGSGSGSLSAMKIAEDFLSDKGKREMVRISRSLDELSRMKVSRESKFTPDPEGDDVRNRPIRNLGELTRIAKPAWAIYQKSRTLFWYQAVTKQLSVRERGVRSERKQLLYIIIDCSGSMNDGQRVAKACGVLMNRLKAVLKGDAVLYWRLFDTTLHEEHFVSTKEEAKAAMKDLAAGNFSGGGTAIDACSRQALARIEEIVQEGNHHRPELVVVSDGNDTVRLMPGNLGGTRLHAFLVECPNPDLTALAIKSGGVGIDNL
jgi:Mg-chelatase subunit ChlD